MRRKSVGSWRARVVGGSEWRKVSFSGTSFEAFRNGFKVKSSIDGEVEHRNTPLPLQRGHRGCIFVR